MLIRKTPGAFSKDAAAERHDFFDCVFAGWPTELTGPEPYAIFVDDCAQPFAEALIRAARGEDKFRGVFTEIRDIPSEAVVICEGPVWDRWHRKLQNAGVRGSRARVLLYFDLDASVFWDFAMACGPDLARIVRCGVSTETLGSLSAFIETWAGGRVFDGRILPLAKYYMRDFLPLQIESAPSIARVMAAMADDESRAAYARILFGTAEQVFSSFALKVFGAQQYMDIVDVRPGDVIINCGVGRGWEIPYFLTRLHGRGALHNIDPNMQYWSSSYAAFIERFRPIIFDHNFVAGESDGKLRLSVGDANMIISDTNKASSAYTGDFVEFDCRSIDSLMREGMVDRVDFLKMDVEGGELAILKGALETIRKHRPKLAVAIYHEPHHFWEYPCFLLDHLEDYRFYLRQYGYTRFETLLYAVPKEAVVSGSGDERIAGSTAQAKRDAVGAPQALFYLRDAPGHPRALYNGPRWSLTRVMGGEWPTAEIDPGPCIEADKLIAVVERKNEAHLFSVHAYALDRIELTIGVSRGPTHVMWTASCRVPDNAVVCLVEPDEGPFEILIWDPVRQMCDIAVHDLAASTSIIPIRASFVLRHVPIIAERAAAGEYIVTCLSETPGLLVRATLREGATPVVVKVNAPPGSLLGPVAIRSHRECDDHMIGWATLDGSRTQIRIFADLDGSMEEIAAFPFDPRSIFVPTFSVTVRCP